MYTTPYGFMKHGGSPKIPENKVPLARGYRADGLTN
jgi:hypothetical protein